MVRRKGFRGLTLVRQIVAAERREQREVRAEIGRIHGLMPLLMKHRNGSPWSPQERRDLHEQLRALAHVSPYLLVFLLPGSFLALPLLAWWLDRRRQQRLARDTVIKETI